ncbi:hypothetical protein DH2020_019775 [Rehmannia glutinosa]|uniref:Uncharacterized protein n=1 Tax=Rehmannia glutinosa TaxID=99300 RepID=A0ABR0WH30_REHGL
MSDQELKFFQGLQEEDNICRSMHHLSTAAHHHHHHPTTAATSSESPEKYTTMYNNSTKRHSPLSPSSFQEPVSKRATLHPLSSPSAASDEYHIPGFTKLPLPHSFPTASPPPLRRTVSEPIYSTDAINLAAPPTQSSTSPHPVLQENPNRNNVPQDSFPFPNPVPVIYRTISDPNPVRQVVAAAGGTPPRPPLARNVSRSPSCGDSPSTKRLKRMKERLKEMSHWWNQVVTEGDDEDNDSENYCSDHNHKEESESEMENPSQEAVWVEKNGECLVLHFKCPCGNGYQILLSGKNCYYKLTNF